MSPTLTILEIFWNRLLLSSWSPGHRLYTVIKRRLRPGAAYLSQGQGQQGVVSQGRGHGGHGGRGPGALVTRLRRLQMRGQAEAQEGPGSQAGGQGANILWADKI